MNILYEDDRVICNDEALIIKDFYYPLEGENKKILYSEIHNIEIRKINFWSGLSKIWGEASSTLQGNTGLKSYWSALDFKRLFKNRAIAIDDGQLVKSVITPEDVDQVFTILKQKTLQTTS
ncbi:MAG: hypothetical protein ACFCU5_10570 [Pleurocapsa sp.]